MLLVYLRLLGLRLLCGSIKTVYVLKVTHDLGVTLRVLALDQLQRDRQLLRVQTLKLAELCEKSYGSGLRYLSSSLRVSLLNLISGLVRGLIRRSQFRVLQCLLEFRT